MDHLHYNPSTDQYEVRPSEAEQKGRIIADISTIQVNLGKGPVGLKQFEELMECSLGKLQEFINDQAALLERVNHSY